MYMRRVHRRTLSTNLRDVNPKNYVIPTPKNMEKENAIKTLVIDVFLVAIHM